MKTTISKGRVAIAGLLLTMVAACDRCSTKTSSVAYERDDVKAAVKEGIFEKIDLQVGQGEEALAGTRIEVHYTGWLPDGTKFDSSVDRNQTFPFDLGAQQVIAGWDEGFEGMKVGGKRILVIPPDKGYGEQGAGGVIPPNATLIFEVELLGVSQ